MDEWCVWLLTWSIFYRINSSDFVIKEGHTNNMRKPFNDQMYEPRYIQARSFRIDYAYFKNLVSKNESDVNCYNDYLSYSCSTQ